MTRWLQSSLVVLAMAIACGAPPAHHSPVPPVHHESPTTSVAPGTTDMLDDLQQIGVDPTKDTDLSKIDMGKKRKLMRLFTKSLGTDCSGCHADDFKEDTTNKKIARHMWSDFVAVLRDHAGAPIFCDTCHQGKMKIIARDDDKVLAAFMKANYVEKMSRGDKQEHKCASCHGDPFEPDIFKNKFKAE
jgi:hypothetical protein